MGLLSKDEITTGLTRLGELAAAEGHHVRLTVMGGAVMALAYNARLSTKDVDAIFFSPPDAAVVRGLASIVAAEFGWDDDWLNDGAKGFLHGVSQGEVLLSSAGITVTQVRPEQLLAMKLSAWRDDTDIQDAARVLAEFRADSSQDDVWKRVEPYVVPGNELKARYALDDLWGTQDESD